MTIKQLKIGFFKPVWKGLLSKPYKTTMGLKLKTRRQKGGKNGEKYQAKKG